MNWHAIKVPSLGPPPEPYEYAIRSGNTLYLAGQVALDENGIIIGTTTKEQARKTWDNIGIVLAAAGASIKDLSLIHI